MTILETILSQFRQFVVLIILFGICFVEKSLTAAEEVRCNSKKEIHLLLIYLKMKRSETSLTNCRNPIGLTLWMSGLLVDLGK